MNESIDRLAHIFEKLKKYIALQFEIASLTAGEKAAKILAKLLPGAVIAFLAMLVFLFASFAAAFALSSYLGSYAWGFLLLAVFYLVIAILIFIFRKKIEKPMINKFIKMFFNNPEEEGNE